MPEQRRATVNELAMVKLLQDILEQLMAIRYAVTKEERDNAMIASIVRENLQLQKELAELRKTKGGYRHGKRKDLPKPEKP